MQEILSKGLWSSPDIQCDAERSNASLEHSDGNSVGFRIQIPEIEEMINLITRPAADVLPDPVGIQIWLDG
jgi:hypothetical protein